MVLPIVAWRVYQRHVMDAATMLAANVPMMLRELAFPAFVLIWMLRPAIREQVRAWRRGR